MQDAENPVIFWKSLREIAAPGDGLRSRKGRRRESEDTILDGGQRMGKVAYG